MFLQMSAGNGLVHESVSVENPTAFSRAEFGCAFGCSVNLLYLMTDNKILIH